jgi:hypothetical protein
MLLALNKVANLHNLGQDMKLKDFFGGNPLNLFPRLKQQTASRKFQPNITRSSLIAWSNTGLLAKMALQG